MKIYSVECISGQMMGPCGIFSTMNLAISEVIHHNDFRTDIPNIEDGDGEAQVIYAGNDDYDYTEYHIAEHELNKWED
jgi:hypothetical protein